MYNVYLADDERLVIHGLEQRVNWERMKCRVIGSAQDGVTALRQIMELKPDIVITDILMPGMTGLELIRRAEQELECAFIIFSGYSEFEYAKQALRLGTVDYLIKPADIEEILLRSQSAALIYQNTIQDDNSVIHQHAHGNDKSS